jgi:hypothetical protein
MNTFHRSSSTAPKGQRGIAILVALIVLVAMSLAGIALMRSVDTASIIAGNIAFRQGATLAGDAAVEAVRLTMLGATYDLKIDHGGDGYYASTPSDIDLTGNLTTVKSKWVSWPDTLGTSLVVPKCLAADAVGNKVCYIAQRLCQGTGDLDATTCYTYTAPGGGQAEGGRIEHGRGHQGPPTPGIAQGYYRITVRTVGPRNNISFLQAFIVI